MLRTDMGTADGKPKTLNEVSKVYGVMRERIRQLETKVLAKLRTAEHLRIYLEKSQLA